jgi:hypothetical protein
MTNCSRDTYNEHLVLALKLDVTNADLPSLLVEVTQVLVLAAAMEAARVMAVLDVETLFDVEGWAAQVEREALERVSRVKVENTAVLAFTHEDAEGFA